MNNALQLFDSSLPVQSIDAYISRVNQIPMLTEEEEFKLGDELHTNNNLTAARQLILPHLRYVVRVARGFKGYGLPLADLIQEGNVGLMKAVKRFNPKLGVRLVSFAVHWIKAEIHEYVIRNWRIVKVATTKEQRKLFFKLRSAKERLGWFTNDEVNAVAKDLNVKPETVREMESRLTAHDAAFDGFASGDDDDAAANYAPEHYLEDHSQNPESMTESEHDGNQEQQALLAALSNLDERSQAIISARWLDDGNKSTLTDLANQYGVSAERIRQLEKNAMKKLKAALI